jgi:penicillin-binding protein-related factor A (putative recombinase)
MTRRPAAVAELRSRSIIESILFRKRDDPELEKRNRENAEEDMSNFGKSFEQALEIQHNLYRAAGIADIYHERTAGKFLPGGKFVPDPDKSRPDFTGVIAPGGRMIAFDAKSVSGKAKSWILKKEQEHQYHALLDLDRFGAISFFLVENRLRNELFLLRVRSSYQVFGRVPILYFKLPYAESELLRIPIEPGYLPDYLPEILDSSSFAASLNVTACDGSRSDL